MANLNRIIGMAGKVIDKQLQKRGNGGHGAPGAGSGRGGTDWRDVVRSAADRLTGDERDRQAQRPADPFGQQQHGQQQSGQRPVAQPRRGPADPDAVAIAKYDYLLRTAPPEQLEQVHHDAFARLTPAQRQQIRDRLNSELPPHEHLRDDSAGGMARAMTRGEVAQPGLVRRVLGGGSAGGGRGGRGGAFVGGAAVGAGAMALGGLGAAVAGGAVLSAAARPVLAQAADLGVDFDGIASGLGDLGAADLGAADLGGAFEGVAGEGEQLLGGFGEQASDLGNDFLGGLFDR
ncbi:hypothetical protein BIU97_04290 [Curtobacterium sp. MCBA15_009]|uniref:hypothetical protein n=1 Tax=Curtobacterium sp. MCBA15_009 TaxID=1898737 RepID=UPI0008DDE779|nr:hypothetical protein [Curtobacterium sp. MCBA15_009]OII12216.1 hypothetical protein BIU97_04290 [Curtobacterium sp. MCBA15_009]